MSKKKTLNVTDQQTRLLETLLTITLDNFKWSPQHGDYRSVNPGAFMTLKKGDRTSLQYLFSAVCDLNREGKSYDELLDDDYSGQDYLDQQIAYIDEEPF